MTTAMQEMLEWVRATMPMDLDATLLIEEKIKSLLDKEKLQIINARIDGDTWSTVIKEMRTAYAEQYYNETFKPTQL
jgi:hypothetical protein